MEKKLRSIIISLSIVLVLVIAGNLLYFGADWFKPGTNQADYSWESDPHRLTYPSMITNVTLNISYGVGNGNINETFNVNLSDHYTTVFDILNSCCSVDFDIHWWAHPTFFITGINGVLESDASNHYWFYEVNGTYINAGANAFSPGNNSIVRWYYG